MEIPIDKDKVRSLRLLHAVLARAQQFGATTRTGH
jgi:hypothetical protein